jgi:hypothetical protein
VVLLIETWVPVPGPGLGEPRAARIRETSDNMLLVSNIAGKEYCVVLPESVPPKESVPSEESSGGWSWSGAA